MIITYWIIALFMAFSGVSGTVGATTLTEKQLAAHDHTVTLRDSGWGNAGPGKVDIRSCNKVDFFVEDYASSPSGSSSAHTHSLSGVKSGSASSLPPYYALAFIMRIA